MKRLFLFLLVFLECFAIENSKIVYLRLISAPTDSRELYVGEKIEVKYSLLLFSNASLLDAEFIPNHNEKLADGVELLNPSSNWIKKEDDSYENTFTYKIKAPNFALPTLKIIAISQDGKYIDSDQVKGKKYEAIVLDHENYVGVLAKELRVLDVRAKKYDEWSNIVIFNLQTQAGNLEDFKLKGVEKQGFHGDIVQEGEFLRGVYYCVVPNHLKELKFSFFNRNTLHYEEKIFPIIIKNDRVSTQTDLIPKNNFLIFSNLLLVTLAMCLFVISFILRERRGVFWLCVGIGGFLVLWLIYNFFALREIVLRPGSVITILPTQNSTIMETIQNEIRVEVLSEHRGFYKVKLDDSKIGWVNQND